MVSCLTGTAGMKETMAKSKPEVKTTETPLNAEQAKIAPWLQKLRFRPVTFGGVSEANVWRRIGELNAMYEQAMLAERARYDALIEEHDRLHQEELAKLREQIQ